jgi:hypothetical protein
MGCDQLVLTTHEREWRNPVSGLWLVPLALACTLSISTPSLVRTPSLVPLAFVLTAYYIP